MNRHAFNAWSFLFGALFVLTAVGWAGFEANALSSRALVAAAPLTLIALGVAGLALTFWRKSPPS